MRTRAYCKNWEDMKKVWRHICENDGCNYVTNREKNMEIHMKHRCKLMKNVDFNFKEDNNIIRKNYEDSESEREDKIEYEGRLLYRKQKEEWECQIRKKNFNKNEKHNARQHMRSEHNRKRKLQNSDELETTDEEYEQEEKQNLYKTAKENRMIITNTNYGCKKGQQRCEECKKTIDKEKRPGKCENNITWVSPDGRTRRQIDYILINEEHKNWVTNSRTDFKASNNSENQHKAIVMEIRTKKTKKDGQKARLKQHIEYNLEKVRLEAEKKIKIEWEEYNYERIKNLKPEEVTETKTQEIKRVWRTITQQINKKLKAEYPKAKERTFQGKEGEEWEKIKQNDKIIKELIIEVEQNKQERREEENRIRLKKALEALRQYKNLRKGGFKIIGKMKKENMIDITGPEKNAWYEVERKEKDKEEIIKTTTRIIEGRTKGLQKRLQRKVKVTGIKKNKYIQDFVTIKLGTEKIGTKKNEEQKKSPKREETKKEDKKREEQSKKNKNKKEERTKTNKGKETKNKRYRLDKNKEKQRTEQKQQRKQEKRWRKKAREEKKKEKEEEEHEDGKKTIHTKEIQIVWNRTEREKLIGKLKDRYKDIRQKNREYGRMMRMIRIRKEQNQKIERDIKEREMNTKMDQMNYDFEKKNMEGTKKIWRMIRNMRKGEQGSRGRNPLEKKDNKMTTTLNENLERWTEWIKDMFTTEDTTPKMEHLEDQFWNRDTETIKKELYEETEQGKKGEKDKNLEKIKGERKKATLTKMINKDEKLKNLLERGIQKEEIRKAIASLKNGKSFGKDAIPGEIYKNNTETMTDILYEIFTEIYNNDTEIEDLNEGLIVLLRKKGEKTKTDNYRPITLVNVIYKILAIIITRRIAPIMNILTDEKQTAYKSNRATTDVLSIIETYTRRMKKGEEKNKSITLIDLSKAFDRANRLNIYSILAKKGIPIELIKIIRKTHTKTKLAPKEQNRIGTTIESNIGVYQGSPLSALLFIIYTNQMMGEYEKEWEKEKKKEKEGIYTRKGEEKIKIRNEREEIKYANNKIKEL